MSDVELSEDNTSEVAQEEDTIKILLATDCHLGYEHSTKRLQGNDSFITFEEILKHAQENEVDFVLLGGDLFHDSKPSQRILLQCMELLKKYTLGDREIKIRFLSNPEITFPQAANKIVNYEDPNLNVSLPIFSIHGNHDNPSFESTGTMDILGASGLINYFGKWSNLNDITIPPLVINKGKTYVSLYGLSYINDQRLSRLFRDDKINFLHPAGIPEPFRIFVLHQNRARHTENGYIPENKLPAFLDLVFWGHEHQCRVKPEQIVDATSDPPRSYYITQPGSSVATSLCEGEATEKHIGLLKVNKNRFFIEPIKLQTVRPFVFDSIHLRDADIKSDYTKPLADFVCDYIDDYIQTVLIPKAELQITGHPDQPTLPLIRLRIFYTEDTETFDSIRITRKYYDSVANPRDMLLFRKDRAASKKNLFQDENEDDNDINECFRHDGGEMDWNMSVQGSISNYFSREDKKNHLTVLSVEGLNEALNRYVEAADDDAFQDVINHQMKKNMQYMKKYDVDGEDEIIQQLKVYRDERLAAEGSGEERRDVQRLLNDVTRRSQKKPTRSKPPPTRLKDLDLDLDEDEDIDDDPVPARGRGRGSRGRGRGAKTTRGGASKAKDKPTKTPLDVSVTGSGSGPTRAPKKNIFGNWSTTKKGNDASTSSANLFGTSMSQKRKVDVYATVSDSD